MSYKPAISSMSLGRAWVHKLPNKLDQAQANGLSGIEIFFEDLEYLAREESRISADKGPTPEAQLHAAETIRKLCDERELKVIEHARKIEEMRLWFKIAKILGTDVIQIPASFLGKDKITGNMDVVVEDLREKEWDLVERVDHTNFGMCLDTYNVSGRVYGYPVSASGKTPNAEEDMKKSLEELVQRVNVKKIFYIQVVDAEKMRSPLVEGHAFYAADQPARMSWSRNARLFAFEEGGYLPVLNVARAIIEGLGYKGWKPLSLKWTRKKSATPTLANDESPWDYWTIFKVRSSKPDLSDEGPSRSITCEVSNTDESGSRLQTFGDEKPSQSTIQGPATEEYSKAHVVSHEKPFRSITDAVPIGIEESCVQESTDDGSPHFITHGTRAYEESRPRTAEDKAFSQLIYSILAPYGTDGSAFESIEISPSMAISYDMCGEGTGHGPILEETQSGEDEPRAFLGPNIDFDEHELCTRAFIDAICYKFLYDTTITGSVKFTLPKELHAGLQEYILSDFAAPVSDRWFLDTDSSNSWTHNKIAGCRLANWICQQEDVTWHAEVFEWIFGKTVDEMLEFWRNDWAKSINSPVIAWIDNLLPSRWDT
ncbi:uncharacterized protein RAG0_00866 [Rhynchosporium agropyri]|uniref:Xylose isomerase-like TIM barrel domain-containing protein n=1 Tax=Rhynchosporium agropyri TaxID=914238 RepID=A0A1E1JUN5_9HELO|nr:uncharacterized protein RAG0_00866 [Rhynchosporium agropyri]